MDMDMSGGSMDGMDGGAAMGTGMDAMGHMYMVFFTGTSTPLYANGWTPSSLGAYAGTCVFLIVLAALFRGIMAAKMIQEARWFDREMDRRYVVVQGKETLAGRVSRDSDSRRAVLSENGVEEDVLVLKKRHTHTRPWRLSVDPLRALMDTVIVGVGYLLMLAVMTMNVGYFMSVLGGTFLGSLLVGRYTAISEH